MESSYHITVGMETLRTLPTAPSNTVTTNPNAIAVYFEGTNILSKDALLKYVRSQQQPSPIETLYSKICEKASTCGSWDDIDAYKKSSEARNDSIYVRMLISCLSSINQPSFSDAAALKALRSRLTDKSAFDTMKDKNYYPIVEYINDGMVKDIIAEHEKAKKTHPKSIAEIIIAKLRLIQKKYPACLNVEYKDLADCLQNLFLEMTSNTEKRDARLFQHIRKNKKKDARHIEFFHAGANHVVATKKMLEDKNELEGVAILIQRQALNKLKPK